MSDAQTADIAEKEARRNLLDIKSLDNPIAMKQYRRFDGIVIIVLFSFLTLGVMLQFALTAGDWDYWIDWRDRRWWPLVAPLSLLLFIGAFTYGIWVRLRLPIVATAVTLLLCLASWASRWANFYEFTYFPMSFVFPSTYIALGIILDCTLAMSRSIIGSAMFGASVFAALVYPLNWAFMAPYKVPVEFNGTLMSVADLMGYEYIRTTTPEYLRIIEESTLRTFGGSVTPLTAVFAAFVGILIYALFLYIGSWINKLDTYTDRIV